MLQGCVDGGIVVDDGCDGGRHLVRLGIAPDVPADGDATGASLHGFVNGAELKVTGGLDYAP